MSEEQIVGILKEHEAGAGTATLCRQEEISEQTCSRWKRVSGGLEVSQARRRKTLEEEKACLKRVVADPARDNPARKELRRKDG